MEQFQKLVKEGLFTVMALTLIAMLGQVKPGPAPVTVNLVGQAAPREVQATIYSATWCRHCTPYTDAVVKELPVDGWTVLERGKPGWERAHVVIDKGESPKRLKADEIESYPTTVIKVKGKIVKRVSGRMTPQELTDAINAAAKKKD